MRQTNGNGFRLIERMKKMLMLAAVLVGTAAASQAGIDIHIGLPLPPLPRVIIGYPAPVVVAPRPCGPSVVVAPMCGPVYGYRHVHYYHGAGYSHGYWHGGYDHSRGGHR
jgi:hypothetical protein